MSLATRAPLRARHDLLRSASHMRVEDSLGVLFVISGWGRLESPMKWCRFGAELSPPSQRDCPVA